MEKKYFHLIALCKDCKYEMGFTKVYSHDTFNLTYGLFEGSF